MEKLITPEDRMFIAGNRCMAGSAICRALQRTGYTRILAATREEFDLLDASAVEHWFSGYKSTVVVLAAANVGGIHANNIYLAEVLLDNLRIQTNVIETAWRSGVRGLLFLVSSCIYPTFAEQPIREEALVTGPMEPTNEWYAFAKIAGIKLCEALRRQHGFDAISLMPTNLYGPGDFYHPTNSHVLPALTRRFHEAMERGDANVTCWGPGTPLRKFLHVDDLGKACVISLEHWQPKPEGLQVMNLGTGVVFTIRELAKQVVTATGFQGEIYWDASKPSGTPKKQPDVCQLAALGWRTRLCLAYGLSNTLAQFRNGLQLQPARLRSRNIHADSPAVVLHSPHVHTALVPDGSLIAASYTICLLKSLLMGPSPTSPALIRLASDSLAITLETLVNTSTPRGRTLTFNNPKTPQMKNKCQRQSCPQKARYGCIQKTNAPPLQQNCDIKKTKPTSLAEAIDNHCSYSALNPDASTPAKTSQHVIERSKYPTISNSTHELNPFSSKSMKAMPRMKAGKCQAPPHGAREPYTIATENGRIFPRYSLWSDRDYNTIDCLNMNRPAFKSQNHIRNSST